MAGGDGLVWLARAKLTVAAENGGVAGKILRCGRGRNYKTKAAIDEKVLKKHANVMTIKQNRLSCSRFEDFCSASLGCNIQTSTRSPALLYASMWDPCAPALATAYGLLAYSTVLLSALPKPHAWIQTTPTAAWHLRIVSGQFLCSPSFKVMKRRIPTSCSLPQWANVAPFTPSCWLQLRFTAASCTAICLPKNGA